MSARRSLVEASLRASVALGALVMIWVVWQPQYFTLPEDVVVAEDESDLTGLAAGTRFLLAGTVEPAEPPERWWQGRFTYRHRERRDFAGGPTKDQRVVDGEDRRPALRFVGSEGTWLLPAGT